VEFEEPEISIAFSIGRCRGQHEDMLSGASRRKDERMLV
jgi:hypothetical protein